MNVIEILSGRLPAVKIEGNYTVLKKHGKCFKFYEICNNCNLLLFIFKPNMEQKSE